MSLKVIGKDVPSEQYWREENAAYAGRIANDYHTHRLAMVRSLIDPLPAGSTVVDFGCGDGVMLADFPQATRIGIEPDPELLDIARRAYPDVRFIGGSVGEISEIAERSVDLVLCLNVAAYFTDAEDDLFYRETSRVLKAGGALVITHSNELFDLFTLNAFTVRFFRDHFGTDPAPLLARPDEPERITYNIRENPLAYAHKLARHGLVEERQGFSNRHAIPPLLDPDLGSKGYPDTLSVPAADRWKLMFTCSTFGSRSVRR